MTENQDSFQAIEWADSRLHLLDQYVRTAGFGVFDLLKLELSKDSECICDERNDE